MTKAWKMAVYTTRWFERWAKKQGLNASMLCAAVEEITVGLYEVDLGGGLFKKRIARQGKGKSGGFRTLVATNKGSRWIFVFGFAKNERGNIDKDEKHALKKLGAHLLALAPHALSTALDAGELKEVSCHAQDHIKDS